MNAEVILPDNSEANVRHALRRWQAELLDFTKANSLLYFKRERSALAISYPEAPTLFKGIAYDDKTFTVFQPDPESFAQLDEQMALLHEPPDGGFSGLPDPRVPRRRAAKASDVVIQVDGKKLSPLLYRLRQRARAALLEQGVNVLFVTFGLLRWRESLVSETDIYSPLLLVPVTLERESSLHPYKIAPLDEGMIVNPTLARKLAQDFNVSLNVPDDGDKDLSLPDTLEYLRQSVAAHSTWEVLPHDAFLGLFSFHKYVMYADLETNAERFSQHPVIRLISGMSEALPRIEGDLPTAEYLDRTVPPAQTFQVLDADASQREAIAAVLKGTNLVIQGPPGTGKSQTITNIIAELLAAEKTVLFVSEKVAALDVVAARLRNAGLGEFCLEAHGKGANRGVIIQELARTLRQNDAVPVTNTDLAFERLMARRLELNRYVVALHDQNNPLSRSAFEVHGELARLQHAPIIPFTLEAIAAATPQHLAQWVDIIDRLVRVGETVLYADSHPWSGTALTRFTPQVAADLDAQLSRLRDTSESLADNQHHWSESWGVVCAPSYNGARWLDALLALLDERSVVPQAWFSVSSLQSLRARAAVEEARFAWYRGREAGLLTRYMPSLFDQDHAALGAALARGGAPFASYMLGDGAPADRAVQSHAAILRALRALESATTALVDVTRACTTRFGLPEVATIEHARVVLAVAAAVARDPQPTQSWFTMGGRTSIRALMAEAQSQQANMIENRTLLSHRFTDEIRTVVSSELLHAFETTYAPWHRFANVNYRREMQRLTALQTKQQSLDYSSALSALRAAWQAHEAEAWFAAHHDELTSVFGSHYNGVHTDWQRLNAALNTIEEIEEQIVHHTSLPAIPARLTTLLIESGWSEAIVSPSAVENAISAAMEALASVRAVVTLPSEIDNGNSTSSLSLAHVKEWLSQLVESLSTLWAAVDTATAQRIASPTTVEGLAADMAEAQSLALLRRELTDALPELEHLFGPYITGLTTDWSQVRAALEWTDRLRRHLDAAPSEEFLAAFYGGQLLDVPERTGLAASLDEFSTLSRSLRALLGDSFCKPEGIDIEAMPLTRVSQWASGLIDELPRLEEWVDYITVTQEVRNSGIGSFLSNLTRLQPDPALWLDAFYRRFYTIWISRRYDDEPALAQFRSDKQEALIAEFRELDRLQLTSASRRIAGKLRRMRPVVGAYVHPKSEPGLLLHEATKRKRYRPLRRLFKDLPVLLPALKPCMMMSPLSVAQFLGESSITFDVVIFDEASQILPADAIGAIGRGTQLVVVGDRMQLPPTRFFAASIAFADDDEVDEELPESILDAAIAKGMPKKSLRWHYRSRHEELIAFSNHHFYESDLVTFPAPSVSQAVEFVHVPDGVYEPGRARHNSAEARRVADLVIDHVRQHPNQSLGVIAFSDAQATAIDFVVKERITESPDLRELLREDGADGFFVKSLEQVQGDERDVIIFSVGYGPDRLGKMTMNFGPLNKEGGERRLNVAVTRAREHVTIVASFLPERINRNTTSARGVHLLRAYLEYAIQGPTALLGAITSEGGEPESPFEEAVAVALKAHGEIVASQIGVSGFRIDLAIKDQTADKYILGIECDGATYHSSKTARDRDRLRQEVLENLGWTIHRVWSTDWIKNPQAEVEKILDTLAAVRAEGQQIRRTSRPQMAGLKETPALTIPVREQESEIIQESSDSSMLPDIASPYMFVQLPRVGDMETLYDTPIPHLAMVVGQIVDGEGPVHIERVMRAIASAYRTRVGSRIRSKIAQAIRFAEQSGRIACREDFLYTRNTRTISVRRSSERPISEVAPEEIATCIARFLKQVFSIRRSDLISGVARQFGYERTGASIVTAIDQIIEDGLAHGRLEDVGGQIRLRTS